jgi:bacillithiol biosynthesis cysteine-adding enzyme BshC
VPPQSAASGTPAIVRQSIDVTAFPWTRPIIGAYFRNFTPLAPFFAGNPFDPAAWPETIARVRRAPRDRATLSAVLTAQLTKRGAPPEALAGARSLADPASVAVLTGQQAGLFGGPLYALLKAITAIQIARRVSAEQRTVVVPVFWVEGEDHDWAEVRTAHLLDKESATRDITLPDLAGAGSQPVASLVLDDEIGGVLRDLEATLPPSEFTAEVIAALARRYRPGAGLAEAFAGWFDDLLGRQGLVVFDAADRAVKPLVADVFRDTLRQPARAIALARDAGQALRGLGYTPQVEAAGSTTPLFYLDGQGRRPIRQQDGQLVVGSSAFTTDELAREASAHPDRFSPNVLLRPVIQDRMFPTVAYVAGPNELTYLAQVRDIYTALDVEPPLVCPRGSATLLDAASAKFLERAHLSIDALQAPDEAQLNTLLDRLLPPEIDRGLDRLQRDAASGLEAIKTAIATVDPTLAGTVDTTRDRLQDTLKTLHSKIVAAAKRKHETLRRQYHRTQSLAFPNGHVQERVLNLAFFANRYGLTVADRLLEALPDRTDRHYVLVL